jgi:uncharacterized protein
MSDKPVHQAPSEADRNRPWWRYPIVWLVISGPLVVVVASLITAGVAIRNVDPVLDTSPKNIEALKDAPAMQARNHALDASRQPADR